MPGSCGANCQEQIKEGLPYVAFRYHWKKQTNTAHPFKNNWWNNIILHRHPLMNPFLIPLTPCSQPDPFLVCKPSPSTSPNTPVQKVKSSPPPSVAFVSYFKGPFISITYTNDNTMHRFKLLPSWAWNYQVPHDTSNSKYFGENVLPDNHCVCTPILTLMCWISHALQPCMLLHQLHLCDKLNCWRLFEPVFVSSCLL